MTDKPDIYKQVFDLIEQGLNYRQIAQKLGIPRNTVASRAYRGAGKVPARRPKKKAA